MAIAAPLAGTFVSSPPRLVGEGHAPVAPVLVAAGKKGQTSPSLHPWGENRASRLLLQIRHF